MSKIITHLMLITLTDLILNNIADMGNEINEINDNNFIYQHMIISDIKDMGITKSFPF